MVLDGKLSLIWSFLNKKYIFFYQIENTMSWPQNVDDQFGMWKHLLNPICVTEAFNRPQNGPNFVLNGKFSQPYSQYSVWAGAYVQSRLSLVLSCYNYCEVTLVACRANICPFRYLSWQEGIYGQEVKAIFCTLYVVLLTVHQKYGGKRLSCDLKDQAGVRKRGGMKWL